MNDKTKHLRMLNLVEEIEDYAIILLDADGNIENWNKGAQRIKGYKPEEIVGQNFRVFYTPADRENKKPDMLISLARTKGKVHDEGWRMRKDGTRFWGSTTISAMYDDQQQVTGFAKITRDLTDKKLAAEAESEYLSRLETQNQELEQFVYIASHDLQEPLLTVINFIELLKVEYEHLYDDDGKLYISFVEDAANRMRLLIKDLLDYSRIGKAKTTEAVNLNDLLRHIVQDLDATISGIGARVEFRDLPTVNGYRTELRQLFQNLIGNAVKFSRPGIPPLISITAGPTNDGWQFNVQDNGIGIEPQYAEKIFLIFQRLHNRDVYPGNGIGLANCKKIVAMHNGSIGVNSVHGQGSCFHFTLNL
jgi:PAS domain S-box-containing protein